MRSFFDPRQLTHAPALEMHNGAFSPCAETPARAQAILEAIGGAEPAIDHGEAPLAAVHTADYLQFLKTAHADWLAAGRSGDAIGYAFPVVARRSANLARIDARLGRYSMDTCTPLSAGSWESAYWGAQAALTALGAVLGGERSSFALCRPPGHHCGADYTGGYCFLNNAAIVAQAAISAGRRVAILDIDYHHGNGTQDIFYHRGDVLFVSIHADPATDYPFFWGHSEESGEGAGQGATLNLPLPRGSGLSVYRPALRTALERICAWGADLVVCSFGADTFRGDPICQFALETADYQILAADIATAGLPCVVVMEGGYAVDALGSNVLSFLSGFRTHDTSRRASF